MSRKKDKWYRQTESLLYNYKSFRIRIMALMQQITTFQEQFMPSMVSTYELREGTNYAVSSPVETAVINRIEGEAIRKLKRKVKNLETMQEIVEISVDTMLDNEQKRLVDFVYNQQQPWQICCQELHIEKNTYYQKKNEVVKVLAWCFGYLPDDEAEEVLGLFVDRSLWEKTRNKSGIDRE